MHPHLAHPQHRPDIDGLRAVAILSVVLFHTFPGLLPGGFIGVDVFFVISGFLISRIIIASLERGRFSFVEFYVRRIHRIFPALLLVLLTSMVAGWFLLSTSSYRQMGAHAAAAATFIQNYTLARESGYFDHASQTNPLIHLWSLAVEEQFYVFWPVLLALAWKRHLGLFNVAAFVAVLSFAGNIYLTRQDPAFAFYLSLSRLWELTAGGMLAYITLHRPGLFAKHQDLQSAFGFVLIAAALALLDRSRDFPGWWALLPTLGAFFVIAAGTGARLNRSLLSNKLLVWIGLISYPLYLWHWPLLSFLRLMRGEPTQLDLVLAIALSALLAWVTWALVENPIRFGKGRRRATAPILIGLFALTGVTGVLAKSDAFGETPLSQTLAEPWKFDFAAAYRWGDCFLSGKRRQDFSPVCAGDAPGKTTVVIWGDSFAASLYRGLLRERTEMGFNLAQFTTGGCPPVLNLDMEARPACRSINDQVRGRIKAMSPDTVILAADWMMYDGKPDEHGTLWNYLPEEKLIGTLTALKGMGIRHIVAFGQLPVFAQSQVDAGRKYFAANLNDRTDAGYMRESAINDARIARIAAGSGVRFVSPINLLCNRAGCLISATPKEFVPLAWDFGHLTNAGSEYVIAAAVNNKLLVLPSVTN